jgi:phosphoglycolate phosphatase-like HAD superfamily hydrolase
MSRGIILFDWDDTLFSKVEYKKNLRDNLARICEVSKEEIFRVEDEYFESLERSDNFQIEKFVDVFRKKFNKKIKLEDFSSDKLNIYSVALFPEVIAVLNELKKNGFKLGIYSQGFTNFQKIKIESSGIKDYFDENFIFISRDKTDPEFIATLLDGAIIIDDKKEVVEKLKTDGRFDLFWINRKNDEIIEGATTVKNLNEFVKQVKPRRNKIVS